MTTLTSIGVLSADSAVKPTISEKYIDTHSYISGTTGSPFFSLSATDLPNKKTFATLLDLRSFSQKNDDLMYYSIPENERQRVLCVPLELRE